MQENNIDYIQIDNYIKTKFSDNTAYVFVAQIKDILPIYCVAVRGRDDVEGAVQRVLNKRRIGDIKEYVLKGNMFFSAFLLNWQDKNWSIKKDNGKLFIPMVANAAQVIDGQHRLEGIRAAVDEDEAIEQKYILIIMTEYMTTKEAAEVFLNINTEQKPVPKSLVYDLFGETIDEYSPITRAGDLAKRLNEDPESPYYQCIKFPGVPQRFGKIDLSTVVSSLKPYLSENGIFLEYNISDFESEYKILYNYFNSMRYFYQKDNSWIKTKNPFMMGAGFYAAIEFLCRDLIIQCINVFILISGI